MKLKPSWLPKGDLMPKLAISNIAWAASEELAIAKTLQELGVHCVEIAPTKVWPDPLVVTDEQIQEYKDFWAKYDIEIVAFQSMLFGKPELTIFDDAVTRGKTKAYLEKFIELAGRVGAEVLVLGSPKNRLIKSIGQEEAFTIAREFFGSLGTSATQQRTNFCIEPNGEAYGCNFITTAAQGLELVTSVDNPGFELHLDTGCMTMSGDDIRASIVNAKDWLRHFHISTPFLEPIEEKVVNHQAAADALREVNYEHIVSIEMRAGDEGQNVEQVRSAVAIAKKYYA
jgi:D-psicose/D-tagatose/L-ribulose 3-epimerase